MVLGAGFWDVRCRGGPRLLTSRPPRSSTWRLAGCSRCGREVRSSFRWLTRRKLRTRDRRAVIVAEDPLAGLSKLMAVLEQMNGLTCLDTRGELRS